MDGNKWYVLLGGLMALLARLGCPAKVNALRHKCIVDAAFDGLTFLTLQGLSTFTLRLRLGHLHLPGLHQSVSTVYHLPLLTPAKQHDLCFSAMTARLETTYIIMLAMIP